MTGMCSSRSSIRMVGFFCLVQVLILVSQGPETVASLSPDGHALLALKSTIDDPTGALDDWVESSSLPCNWTAIQCDEGGNVISLQLSKMSLGGNLSSAIGSLAYLTTLSLDSNNFTGSLPPEITRLTRLQFFNISDNIFSAGLPSGLSNLVQLTVLDCYNNNLSGELPAEIVSLRNLNHVHLGGNIFSGSIPKEYGGFSSSLDYFSLSGNDLTGVIPPELGNLTGLTHLYLGWYNSFQGGIPPELGRLSKLVLLDLSSCQLSGSLPSELSNLTKLETLFLYTNNLSGTLPPELGSLASLRSLDVSLNLFHGEIPPTYGNLLNLTLLNVFKNFLSGEIPEVIGQLPDLQVLQVWKNNLTGAIPQTLGIGGSLIELDVSDNLLRGGLPPYLCMGGKLQTLITYDNFLSGYIPDGVGNCSSLQYIRIGGNLFSGLLPPGFFTLPNATMLQLNENNFSGPIPEVIQSPLLQTLDLSENQLGGIIPDAIGNLSSLQTLHLESNDLTGSIPSTICDTHGLYDIELSWNKLSGGIPSTMGNCFLLSKLDLSWNNLTGGIPNSLVHLDSLAILDLSHNLLSGQIPEEFGSITTLTQVDFAFNNFSGPIPTQGDAENYNETAFDGNPFLCGGRQYPACSNTTSGENKGDGDRTLLAWLVGAFFGAALLVLLIGVCCFCRKYRYQIMGMFRKEGAVRPWKFTPFQRLDFTAVEIVECLTEDNIIGRGGAGTVYRGEMANGEMVAVKRLACGKGMSSHDHGFSAEIRTLGKIRHRYIVRLLGFCTNHEMNLLVYEYMPNGSLGEFLHDSKKSGLLDWNTRYNIAFQAATGLSYLHHDCSPLIVHRDVKSNNILLDSNLEARVADFGLAKLFQNSGKSESMSSIAGSYGYIAPEYAYTLKVNEKSDIYSFGVVLMELLTGRRPIEPEFGDGVDIVQWVRLKIQTKEGVLEILDPKIGGVISPGPLQEVMLVLRVALLCSSDQPVDRPTMRDVVQMLSDVRPTVRTGSMDSRELKPQPLLTEDLLKF
ncbi:unnamed protein product [Calypogeia fissa]